jgi:hypothetical protein
MPALLAMVLATGSILTGDSDPSLWIKLLLGYDIIFTTVSLLLFDVVLHAEYLKKWPFGSCWGRPRTTTSVPFPRATVPWFLGKAVLFTASDFQCSNRVLFHGEGKEGAVWRVI